MKILGYNYTIDRAGNADDLQAFADFRSKTQVIRVASDLFQEQAESTLLHEVIEALNFHLELKLEHPAIMRLEAGLYQVLADNGVDLSPLLEG